MSSCYVFSGHDAHIAISVDLGALGIFTFLGMVRGNYPVCLNCQFQAVTAPRLADTDAKFGQSLEVNASPTPSPFTSIKYKTGMKKP